jgi:tryptophan synthase beta chain
LLKEYGRPTPLYFAKRLSEQYNTKIYLKRKIYVTGAHKSKQHYWANFVMKRLGKTNHC